MAMLNNQMVILFIDDYPDYPLVIEHTVAIENGP